MKRRMNTLVTDGSTTDSPTMDTLSRGHSATSSMVTSMCRLHCQGRGDSSMVRQ